MPSHKVLRSVTRSVADSFTSLMNWWSEDYVMGHLVRAARTTKCDELTVDMLTGVASPESLLVDAVRQSLHRQVSRFPELVQRSGSDMSFVRSARMMVKFDLNQTRPIISGSKTLETPYRCSVQVVDERGKEYKASLDGWWYPESEDDA
jgi:hypothetical protein